MPNDRDITKAIADLNVRRNDYFWPLQEAVIEGRITSDLEPTVGELIDRELDRGMEYRNIIGSGIYSGLVCVGNQFLRKNADMPQLLTAIKAAKAGIEVLKQEIPNYQPIATAIIGNWGDTEISDSDLVGLMLESVGWEVYHAGIFTDPEQLPPVIDEHSPQLVALWTNIAEWAHGIGEVVRVLSKVGYRSRVKVLAGGRAMSEDYALKLGADGYAPDFVKAVNVANKLVTQLK